MDDRKSDDATQDKVVRSYSVDREHHAYLRWRAAQGSLKVSGELRAIIDADATERLGIDWRERFARTPDGESEAAA